MWKNMLKGIINNVYKEVKEEVTDKVGEQFKKATGNAGSQTVPVAEAKKPVPIVPAESVEKPHKAPEQEVVLESADAEATLDLPVTEGERGEVSTLSEQTYSYLLPQGDQFKDRGDCGAAEIYQCYEYEEAPGKEPAAMYFSIAPEFNCEIRESVAKAAFTRYEGTPIRSKLMTVEHPVFTHVYLFESAKTYRLTYLRKIDEYELLGCELVLKKNLADEEMKAFLVKEFKRFAGSCRMQ